MPRRKAQPEKPKAYSSYEEAFRQFTGEVVDTFSSTDDLTEAMRTLPPGLKLEVDVLDVVDIKFNYLYVTLLANIMDDEGDTYYEVILKTGVVIPTKDHVWNEAVSLVQMAHFRKLAYDLADRYNTAIGDNK